MLSIQGAVMARRDVLHTQPFCLPPPYGDADGVSDFLERIHKISLPDGQAIYFLYDEQDGQTEIVRAWARLEAEDQIQTWSWHVHTGNVCHVPPPPAPSWRARVASWYRAHASPFFVMGFLP